MLVTDIEPALLEAASAAAAPFDAATGLATRANFEARLVQSIADARRQHRKAALLRIYLDRDSLDEVVLETAQRLMHTLRQTDTVARLSGREFVVFVKDLGTTGDVVSATNRLHRLVAQPVRVRGVDVAPSPAMGISVFPDDGPELDALLRLAGLALHQARSGRGTRIAFYATHLNARLQERWTLETDLLGAIDRNELRLHYQPQLSLAGGKLTGIEALLRWQPADREIVPAGRFIALAEEAGLTLRLGEWVLQTACAQMRQWLNQGLKPGPVAINVSPRQFLHDDFVPQLQRAMQVHDIEPRMLELEVTETALSQDADNALAAARELKDMGLRMSLDDFGTGYSSLSQLKRLPLHRLKIDRAFAAAAEDGAISQAAIALAHGLGVTAIAEKVESQQQLDMLRRHGCDEIQGHLVSRPLPADELAAFVRRLNRGK